MNRKRAREENLDKMEHKIKTDDAATIVANMALAHEMIMTDNFQLTPVSELENERYTFF